ncbi:hypothetical protein V6N12_020174 [Hibiscus sabdariffa]|uniref:DUF4283 domain-containing protein n=1 Tax=Hibiscus sabdariffa TaxID=183260 RepID=A0ABR1ZHV8_9ROSI
MRARDCLHGKWIHGSHIRVNLAERESQTYFWRRKHGDSIPGASVSKVNVEGGSRTPKANVVTVPPEESHVTCRRMEGSEMEDFLLVWQCCLIGWCWSPISNSSLAKEIHLERIIGVHVMRISRLRVLLIFDSVKVRFGVPVHTWSCENFERLVSYWGSVVLIEEATLEPSSFEHGRVLIETSTIDRIEEQDSSSSSGESVRVREEEQSDRGDVSGTIDITGSCDNGMKVPSDEEVGVDIVARQDEPLDRSPKATLGEVCWQGNGL